ETDPAVKKVWEHHLYQEIAHLQAAAQLLEKYENKHWSEVIPNGAFPELLKFHSNIDYVRDVLRTVSLTAHKEDYMPVQDLPKDYEFFKLQDKINGNVKSVPSHRTIAEYIDEFGQDYRFEVAPHPVVTLRNREKDNISVGRETN
ncbi:MAG: hypothetical protein GX891_03250, partial [Clostridiales bacterium]|nr:hypothetical protein [Clostridiales bacterium]